MFFPASEPSTARKCKHPPTDRRNFSQGAIMLLPDHNHLSQVSTTCSSCIYHIGSLPLTPSRDSLRFASRCSSSTCRHQRRHIRTRVHARKQIWMANYGDNDAELDRTGRRRETLFDDARARLSSASQLQWADLSQPDDRSLRVIIINENLLDQSLVFYKNLEITFFIKHIY